jgi:hypothetical protein
MVFREELQIVSDPYGDFRVAWNDILKPTM